MRDLYEKGPNDLERIIREQEIQIKKLENKLKDLEQQVESILNQFRNKGAV